jgi:hypothetical protein
VARWGSVIAVTVALMASLRAVWSIESDDEDAFWADFDEDRIAASLPAWAAWLLNAHDLSEVGFHIETDSAAQFRADFDEAAFARALPAGCRASLVQLEQQLTPRDRAQVAWRRLMRRPPL